MLRERLCPTSAGSTQTKPNRPIFLSNLGQVVVLLVLFLNFLSLPTLAQGSAVHLNSNSASITPQSCGSTYMSFYVWSNWYYAYIYVDGRYWGKTSVWNYVTTGWHYYYIIAYRYDNNREAWQYSQWVNLRSCQHFTYTRSGS
jgi:hypothetical protein